jgi:hypothetical protein
MKQLFSSALCVCALSISAYADTLTPGAELQPPDILSLAGLTLVASETDVALNSLTFTADLTAAVYSGNDTSCPTTDCLIFAYQVTDTGVVGPGTGIIEDLTASNFSNYSTDVGYDSLTTATSVFAAGGSMPLTVGRSLSGPGAVVTFDYPDADASPSDLVPGESSAVLIVETNATNYTTGLFSAIDGATATVDAFGPASSTPEPASMALIGLVLMGFGLLRKRTGRQN